MMRVPPLMRRQEARHVVLNRARRFAQRQSKPVSNPKNVRVDSECRTVKGDGEHDGCRFAADSGQRFKLFAFLRHAAAVLLDECARRIDDILGFDSKEPAGLDDRLHIRRLCRGERTRIGIAREQKRRGQVYALIRALRRQNDRDEQLERIAVIQCGQRGGIRRFENL